LIGAVLPGDAWSSEGDLLRWGSNRLDEIRDGQARAAADRKRLVERLQTRAARVSNVKPPETSLPSEAGRRLENLNIDDAMAAAGRLEFMLLDDNVGPRCSLNRPTLNLLGQFLGTLKTG
jgi:hypothetical protein